MQAALFPVMLIVLWLVMVRPQQQQAKRRRELLSALQVGDEVIVAGAYGTVKDIDGDVISVEVAPGTVMRFARGAVNDRILPPETDSEPE